MIVLFWDFRKRDKRRPKVRGLVDQKRQQEQRTISLELPACVIEGWLLQTSLHNWNNIVKKCGNVHLKAKTLWSWPICQNCCQEITIEKIKQCQKAPLYWRIFRLNRRGLCAAKSQWKNCNPLYHTNWESCGIFLPMVKSGICTRWWANWIRPAIIAYYSITWSHLEGGLWVKNLYSCKITTQSMLINSTRGTLKVMSNSKSFNWCLGRCN